jgi:hypothetical protein
MPEFTDPAAGLRTSFLAAVAEFRADRDYPVPWFAGDAGRPALSDPAAFGAYAARLLGERAEPGAREGLVPATGRTPRKPPAEEDESGASPYDRYEWQEDAVMTGLRAKVTAESWLSGVPGVVAALLSQPFPRTRRRFRRD